MTDYDHLIEEARKGIVPVRRATENVPIRVAVSAALIRVLAAPCVYVWAPLEASRRRRTPRVTGCYSLPSGTRVHARGRCSCPKGRGRR